MDFPLLQRIALPITTGSVRYPGIKIHDTRIIRLLEVLLHNGTTVGGWTTKQVHEALIAATSNSPPRLMASTNSATISANSKVTDYSNAMDDDMPTG